MNALLIPLLQSAGAVALAVMAFSLAFTWSSLTMQIQGLRTEGSRLRAYGALGLVMLFAAAVIYLAPGLLLRDTVGLPMAVPLLATWLITAGALVVRGLIAQGAVRAVSWSYAVVAAFGAGAGLLSALAAQHRIADTITPTGGFLLAIGAIAGIVFWAGRETPRRDRSEARRA
ncbi:hypothetical protein P5G50_03240 [Leifsonia sp. F6_8S_P_1B]|uniref:Uncharacterized protein n=1 Tax=Leifsonia williamsii TaxID=3035919 RepID=A0ABT8K7M9_9MICO|nr:hypothetical protein [Leifsonia williamsii]MDN4613460.1 hypothetical protein [Leifsonia williamsii]